MPRFNNFERDFKQCQITFPKLNCREAKNFWKIEGELDICDSTGVYWGSFEIKIIVPHGYPYCIPLLFETSHIIPRSNDYHIDKNGLCCVDMNHKLLFRSKSGIPIFSYISEWVYPFLANQLFRLKENRYAGSEYAHQFAGVQQFYLEELNLDPLMAESMLHSIISKTHVGRNDPCPCGSAKKLKKCHQFSYDFLKTIGQDLLNSDLKRFQANGSKPD